MVLNVEADHLDYFHDLADIQRSPSRKFTQLVPKGDRAGPSNGDDPNTMEALKGLELTTFGLGEKKTGCTARDIRRTGGTLRWSVTASSYCNIHLNVFGRQQRGQRSGCRSVAWTLGIPRRGCDLGAGDLPGEQAVVWSLRAELQRS